MKSLTRTISIIAIILISINFDLSPSQKVTETSKNLNECTCQCEYGKNNGLATSFFRNNCFEKDETFHKENNFTCFFEQSCSSTQAIFQTNENINRSIDFPTNPVSTMTILPGGSIAFGSYDKIQIRDLKNEEISKIDRLLYWISSFAVLNDNYSLASASKNGLIRIWDMRNLNIFRDIKINNRTIHSLAVLTDDLLASAYEDKKIRILNLNKNKKIKIITLDGHDDEVFCLAVLPNGLLASGSFDKTIRIWNVTEQKTITKLEGHHNVVSSLAVLAKNLLASASWDKSIRIWDLNSRTAINILYGHTHRLTCLVVLPNGLIASSSWDKTIRIWNVTRKKETKIIYGKNGGINALAVFDDSSLISSSFDKKINVWEKQTILDELNFTCLFEEDSSCANGTIYQGSESEVNMLLTDQNASITCLLVLSDGLLASAYANGNIFIWNLTSRKYTSLNTSHNDTITSLIDLSNGLLASASWDRSIKIWNLTLKEEINSFDNKESAYFSKEAYVSITFLTKLSNGLLASASFKSLKIWNITRREMKEFEIKSFSFVNSLVALNDNASIVIASDDKTIEIVNIRNQTKIDLVGHTDGVTCLLVLSDTLLASGSYDKTVKIWENFKIHKTFNHNYYVTSLALLPDGLLASGSFKEIIIWDIKNEITVQTLIGHSNFVNSLVVLSNGLLASAASENKIIIWKIKPIKSNQSVVLSILCCLIVIFLVVVLISAYYFRKKKSVKKMKKEIELNDYLESMQLLLSQLDCKLIQIEELNDKNEWMPLGEGHFGKVFKGVYSQNNANIAIKEIKSNESCNNMDIIREANILSSCNHENIVKLHGVCNENNTIYLIMEYMNAADLRSYLIKSRTNKKAMLRESIDIIKQIIKGCLYLEEKKIVHRDLAARNCLLNKDQNKISVKISDLGLARNIYTDDFYRRENEKPLPFRWMAPESLIDGFFTNKTDVWSFGILVCEIFSFGAQPYMGMLNWEVIKSLENKQAPNLPDNCPIEITQLLRQIFSFDPESRPTFKMIDESFEDYFYAN